MAKLDLSQADFLFRSDALPDAALLVHQFSGREALSQCFEFEIDLVCADRELDLDAPIGQPVCLTLRGRLFDGTRYARYVHGVLCPIRTWGDRAFHHPVVFRLETSLSR